MLNIYNLIDTDMIMPVKLLQASGLHVTYWRHSGESGGPIYHQYPPFFYSELRNFAVLSSPRKSAMGFRSPDPEDVKGKLSRRWGINIRLQQAKPVRGGSSIIQQRKVCWRLRDDTMFQCICILSILLAQYTHEFLFISINQMFGVKKKKTICEQGDGNAIYKALFPSRFEANKHLNLQTNI